LQTELPVLLPLNLGVFQMQLYKIQIFILWYIKNKKMKKLFTLVSFVFIVVVSCNKDTLDTTFTTNISATSSQISVNDVTMNKGADFINLATYSETFVVKLDNSETQDYLDKLKDISLSDVRLQFNGLSGLASNHTETNFMVTFDNQISFQFTDFKYSEVANGQDFELDDSQKIAQIAEILLEQQKISIKVEGSIPDTATYHFVIKFLAKADITANAL
jgi:hypothetical protein